MFVGIAPTALASGCRGNTPTLKKGIEELESDGFECDSPQLSIDPAQVSTPEKKEIFRIYKDTLIYLVNSTSNRNVSNIGANFEYAFYKNGPVFLDGFPKPVSLRVSQNRVDFSHKELTLCTRQDPKSGIVETVEIDAEIQVKGIIGLTGVCRRENKVAVSAPKKTSP
jgi:hypothetical protein